MHFVHEYLTFCNAFLCMNILKIGISDLVTFDNSYSWTKGKKVYYNIDLIDPEDVRSDLDVVTQGGSWQKVAEQTEMTHL